MASDMRFGPGVRRVTALTPDASGQLTPTVLYVKGGEKKKQNRALKPFETFARRAADAAATGADLYLVRHAKSNTKRRDGWLKDLGANVFKAGRKGSKRAKMSRWLMMSS